MKTCIVGLFCCAVLALSASPARADAIIITSGAVEHDNQWTEHLVWDNSNVGLFAQFAFVAGPFPFQSAQPGDVIDVSASFNGPLVGFGTLDGVEYPVALEMPLVGSASFQIAAAPLIFGRFVEGSQTTFTMNGFLTLGARAADPIIQSEVTGSGRFIVSGGAMSFLFTNASSSPTPEPTTALLFGTGILAIALRRFRTST